KLNKCLMAWAIACVVSYAQASGAPFEIKVSKPEFVLPQFTGPYQEREASIAPEEYERAEKLRSLLAEGRKAEVITELEKSYSIELSPAMLALQAQVYFSLEMYEKAEDTYLTVLRRMPQLIRAHSDLGQLYLVREQPVKAREYFAKAVALGSHDAAVYGQLGYLNLTLHGPFSAISSYQQAAAIEPDNMQWQQGLLAALTQAHMYEAAEALLDGLIARQPAKVDFWLNKAALAMHKEDYRNAVIGLEMAIMLGDKDPRNLKSAAQLHLQLGSFDRALELLDQSMVGNDLPMASIREYYYWLSQLGLWAKAETMLELAGKNMQRLKRDEQSQYYLLAAQLKAHQTQVAEAGRLFRQALELDPTNSEALLAFAGFAVKQKNYTDAELLYVRAEAIPNSEKRAQLGRAQLYIDMQDYKAALNQLRAVYQKNPDAFEVKDNIEVIENIIRTNEAAAL
ncbi:MAG TPA: tetratricopeptide repeat protein, partial [Cellvibrionaceae bacterium]|nr:tetratricopeptide repeat protein [Cellvibrionaceae bacterium]